MARRAILHIGVMKTGSSSIQSWLSRERRRLATQGVHVPVGNMSFLATTMQADPDGPRAQRSFAKEAKLLQQLADLPSDIHTVVLSGEALGQHLHTQAPVARLKELLDAQFSEYVVVVYLRRQDQQSVSHYAYSLRRGQNRPLLRSPMDYATMLDVWADVFGADAIRARVFERQSLVAGDAVADFADVTALGPVGEPLSRGDLNPSNRPAAQLLLESVFEAVSRDSGLGSSQFASADGYRAFMRELDANFAGTGALPPRAEARAFFDACRESNENVRQRWFPERKALFDEDFSRYPEQPQTPPSRDEVLSVAAKVLGKLLVSPVWGGTKRPSAVEDAAEDRAEDTVGDDSEEKTVAAEAPRPASWKATVREERMKARAEKRLLRVREAPEVRRARKREAAAAVTQGS